MATHSNILARNPMEEPGGLQSMRSQESDNLATKPPTTLLMREISLIEEFQLTNTEK